MWKDDATRCMMKMNLMIYIYYFFRRHIASGTTGLCLSLNLTKKIIPSNMQVSFHIYIASKVLFQVYVEKNKIPREKIYWSGYDDERTCYVKYVTGYWI